MPNNDPAIRGVTISINTRKWQDDGFQNRDILALKEVQQVVTPSDPQRVWIEYFVPLDYELEDEVYYEMGIQKIEGSIDLRLPLLLEYEY